MIEELDKLIKDRELYNKLLEELQYDKTVVLPTKTYKGNCSKEYCEKIVDLYIDREFERIQEMDFPPTVEHPLTLSQCQTEFINLLNNDKKWKSPSYLVRYFHKSIIYASVGNNLSPFDGWANIKKDKETFKKFYANRLRCSDWFNEKDINNKYLPIGYVPDFIYGIGLSTSRMFQFVTYFKPALAKYLIKKYLNEYSTVFDPFSGYSGRMIGALAARKNYIGQDLCELSVAESEQIRDFILPLVNQSLLDEPITCELSVKDTINSTGVYDCLLTCSPYENIENWKGVPSLGYTCDKWIDICLENFDCNKYVFVTDNKIKKYKAYVKEQLVNTSHFAENVEYVVVITKEERNNILNGEYKNIEELEITDELNTEEFKVTFKSRSKTFTQLGVDLFNIFNLKAFKKNVVIPEGFNNIIQLLYNKFEISAPNVTEIPYNAVNLTDNKEVVILTFSGGLDSCYQALKLKEQGYEVHLFHMSNANRYENGQGTKVAKEFAAAHNFKFIEAKLSNGYKYWPENPLKNQMILTTIIDYCIDNGYNRISLGESLALSTVETVAGINTTDSKDLTYMFIDDLKKYVNNLVILEVEGTPSKLDKLNLLSKYNSIDLYYSCLQAGRFNASRHKQAETKFNIKLPLHNCGCYCRKCATQNLLLYYGGVMTYPEEFIEKCWKIMYDNGFSSEKRFFTPDIPLEQRIKNLYEQ